MAEKPKPTPEQFETYQRLFDYFNAELFNNRLPSVILNFSRKANSCGFFAPHRWGKGQATTHEISINPTYLAAAPFMDVCQTLVHEMCHLEQMAFGKPSRTGYHNKQWSEMMEAAGLMPSTTGAPGGARVGQSMNDYPIPGGAFEKAFNAIPDDYRLPWHSRESAAFMPPASGTTENGQDEEAPEFKPPGKSKVKYSCPECSTNVWGKPGLQIKCSPCDRQFSELE